MLSTIATWGFSGLAFGLGVGLGAWCMRPNRKLVQRRLDNDVEITELLRRKTEAVERIAEIMEGEE